MSPEPVTKLGDYLTLPEVAARYRAAENTVRYWRHTGYGPRGVRVGARVLYPRAEIEKFDRQLAEQASAALRHQDRPPSRMTRTPPRSKAVAKSTPQA